MKHHVDFQFSLTQENTTHFLKKEQEKKEIQEGLIKACDVIDLIIEILRGCKNRSQAKDCLVNGNEKDINFKSETARKAASVLHFTERQASAILELRLYRLIGLEILELQKQYEQTLKKIANTRRYLEAETQ